MHDPSILKQDASQNAPRHGGTRIVLTVSIDIGHRVISLAKRHTNQL